MQIESTATFSKSSDSSETNQKSKKVQSDKGDSKFERFLEKKQEEGYVKQDLLVVTVRAKQSFK